MAEDSDLAVEKEFLRSPKALRVLITDKDLLDQHKSLVCTALRCEIKVFLEMKANFKSLSRSLINVAAKLTHSKDVRGLSTDLVEKFVELCCSDRWTVGDLWLFLTHYISSAHTPDSFKHRVIWDR